MLKRRIFNPNESCPDINLNVVEEITPNRGGIHPALLSSVTPQPVAKEQNASTPNANPKETVAKSKPDSAANGQDSDSDPMEVPGFFSSSNLKLPYTKQEDELILKYVLKGQNIFKVSSLSLWKHLEAKKDNPKRTYQSLKNRFLRNIKPSLFTTYGYLIKDKTTTERILSKFPELKQQLGRRETLSKIKLPERKLPPKTVEDDRVSSTSTNESQNVTPRDLSLLSPVLNHIPSYPVRSEQVHPETTELKTINSDPFKSVFYPRIVKADNEGITVSVNFAMKKYIETPSVKIYDRFRRLERKNKLTFCPTCGRYNRPQKVSPLKYCKETDVLIPNSLETPKTPLKTSVKTNLDSKPRNRKDTKPKKITPTIQTSCKSPGSPSLLSGIGEGDVKSNKCASSTVEGNSKTVQAPVVSNSTGKRTLRNKTVRTATASSSESSKKPGTPSRAGKRRRGDDDEIDSICEDAVTNFRKLIDYEEEQQLVRKCLNKNFKSIGVEDISECNLDSYFLDSSSDMDTPALTIDCETDSQDKESETTSEKTGCSSLAVNMKKMLHRNKKS